MNIHIAPLRIPHSIPGVMVTHAGKGGRFRLRGYYARSSGNHQLMSHYFPGLRVMLRRTK